MASVFGGSATFFHMGEEPPGKISWNRLGAAWGHKSCCAPCGRRPLGPYRRASPSASPGPSTAASTNMVLPAKTDESAPSGADPSVLGGHGDRSLVAGGVNGVLLPSVAAVSSSTDSTPTVVILPMFVIRRLDACSSPRSRTRSTPSGCSTRRTLPSSVPRSAMPKRRLPGDQPRDLRRLQGGYAAQRRGRERWGPPWASRSKRPTFWTDAAGRPTGVHQASGGYPTGIRQVDGGYPTGIQQVDGGYPTGIRQVDGGYPTGIRQVDGGYPTGIRQEHGGISHWYPAGVWGLSRVGGRAGSTHR